MITAIIVDDEWAVGQWLSLKLRETGVVEVTGIIQNPLELMAHIKENRAEVVFLDIAMPEITGLELAEQLSVLENPPEVVFVTAYGDYALEAFRVNALDYIVKPVNEKELQRVLEKVTRRLGRNRSASEGQPPAQLKHFFSVTDIKLEFSTAKCEELFLYMLLKSKQPISKWEIIEDLWPAKERDKGESNMRTTVFRLNQTLEKAGLDLRVKASKGYYHFISVSNKSGQIAVQPFPPQEELEETDASIVELLQQYNFLQLIEEKDYLWAVMLKQYETSYYQWAMHVIEQRCKYEHLCLQALQYLLEMFPWQEPLIVQIMPLILKLEGNGALTRFYQQQQQKWNKLYDIPLSKAIQEAYQELLYER